MWEVGGGGGAAVRSLWWGGPSPARTQKLF